ncbi:hypothetical protein AVEN_206693-1 [Araneus ventricosus]|uniref:Mos1 transposase HTH domain-containing protein n=1 Tax=Araneus ventricosus TaxID=182803 RepID=A0A4Y1ZU94_ARAVE|nr:hypothetical protein AVEN_206693-1 [Araneus ventricosus]
MAFLAVHEKQGAKKWLELLMEALNTLPSNLPTGKGREKAKKAKAGVEDKSKIDQIPEYLDNYRAFKWSQVEKVATVNIKQKITNEHSHRHICEAYGATALCEGKVRKWVTDFKAGRDNVHGDSRSGRPSVITEDMVASVEAKILENRRFTISTLSNDFPEVSRLVQYKIVSEKLNFQKLCSRWSLNS